MSEIRYILRRTSDNRVLCRPSRPGELVSWEPEQMADQRRLTMEFPSEKGANHALKNYGPKGLEIIRQERNEEEPATVSDQITDYLASGGLFNPEFANHDSVRDLLIQARDEFDKLEPLPVELIAETA